MSDEFKQLVTGINPTSGTGTTEWFAVPANHQYQGYVRATFNASSGSATSEYKIYGLSSSGAATTNINLEARNELDYGDFAYHNFDMGPGEVLSVGSDSDRITFNFRGLDIDG